MTWESRSTIVLRACALIEDWVGVKLGGAAPERLYEFLERRATSLGFLSPSEYVAHAETLGTDAPEARRLINLVTNGLTAFWRDPPQLDAVRLAMTQIGQKRDTNVRPLAIWCAGCATGEEAYTLAMLAAEAQIPTVVLGTDINSDFLSHARDARYGEWSLRRLDPRRAQAYFVKGEGNTFHVSSMLRQRVYFRQHNLLEAPPMAPTQEGWDLILCRNVLIYFAESTTRAVIDNFSRAIQPDGYLMLGSSEQLSSYYSSTHYAPFRAARHGAGFVYRLATTPPGATVYNLPLYVEQEPSHETLRNLMAQGSTDLDEDTLELDQNQAVEELLDAGVNHLMRRDREGALACFEATSSYDPFVDNAYFLIGLLLRDRARQHAIASFRKALFINPYHWLAAFELARIHDGEGEVARARLAYRQAIEGVERGEVIFENERLSEFLGISKDHAASVASVSKNALARLR